MTSPAFAFSRVVLPLTALLLGSLFVAACDDEAGSTSCVQSTECAAGQVCTGGQCIDGGTNSCRSVDDCEAGESCDNNVCVEPVSDAGNDADAGVDTGIDVQPDLTPDTPDVAEEEVNPEAPVVVSTDPEDGEDGVNLNATVSVEFDQPMVPETFTATNIRIEDYSGEAIERRISYNAPTNTVALEPINAAGNFDAASPYTLIITTNVRAENNLTLATQVEVTFFTEGFPDMDAYQDLAEAYAPVIYAEVREPADNLDTTPRIDWFTSLDFDGDTDATNNRDNVLQRSRTVPAVVYYNVLETQTHYLVQYILYYPAAVVDPQDESEDAVEHDFAYALVVVQKLDDDELGRFVMAEGLGDAQVFAFGLSSYPNPCGGDGQPLCGGADPQFGDVWVDFDASELEPAVEAGPGRRYPLFLTAALHASCLAPSDDTDAFRVGDRCSHETSGDSAPFDSDFEAHSRILRLGGGENWSSTATETGEPGEMTYTLVPFLDLWWTQRSNIELWDDSRSYVPPVGAAGEGSYKVPSRLAQEDDTASDPSRRAPFQAEADLGRDCDSCSRIGVWFIDPIWELDGNAAVGTGLGHVDFDHVFSQTYCFNPFLDIDLRGETNCE